MYLIQTLNHHPSHTILISIYTTYIYSKICMIYDFQSAPKDLTATIVQRHVCIQSMDGYATNHVIVPIFNIATLLMVV